MDPTVLKALVAGAFTVLGVVIGWLFKERRFRAKRFREREKSFERAQEGYRPCYRKFTINLAVSQAGFDGDPETRIPTWKKGTPKPCHDRRNTPMSCLIAVPGWSLTPAAPSPT